MKIPFRYVGNDFSFQVEELEMKARLARNQPKKPPKAESVDRFANYDRPEVINKQLIDLRIVNQDEEFDSD